MRRPQNRKGRANGRDLPHNFFGDVFLEHNWKSNRLEQSIFFAAAFRDRKLAGAVEVSCKIGAAVRSRRHRQRCSALRNSKQTNVSVHVTRNVLWPGVGVTFNLVHALLAETPGRQLLRTAEYHEKRVLPDFLKIRGL